MSWSERGPVNLWALPPDGGDLERLTDGDVNDVASSWSPDGRFLAYVRYLSAAAGDIFLYRF